MYMEDIMSTPINLAGLPSLAFPVASGTSKLPLGLQLIAPRRHDKAILKFVKEII